ncbi:hypothetical protein Y032_0395g652 [Ancylostoma ceylanicum]|uniref:CC domain-containing protein n=1 Tax=Ancylostoma ceylanicum TaxID=53326 RepID=A0A016RRP9_9BILA|nr:hypothetical protein Y032_0395g652 [Ancylostoma ceylanicum]
MISQLVIFAAVVAVTVAQLCPPGCMQQSFGGGCGGCGGIRAYRVLIPPPMMGPAFNPCGGSPCGPQMMPMSQIPCNSGGCGGMGQQMAMGIPDPIITESGRIVRVPFLPPPRLPPQAVGQNPMVNNVGQGR